MKSRIDETLVLFLIRSGQEFAFSGIARRLGLRGDKNENALDRCLQKLRKQGKIRFKRGAWLPVGQHVQTYLCWIKMPGLPRVEQRITLEPGENVEEACAEVITTLIANEIDSGWEEAE